MGSSLSEDLTHEDCVFDVLKEIVVTIGTTETQVLHGKGSRFLNGKFVKEEETTMK